jgi:hypothetical protein
MGPGAIEIMRLHRRPRFREQVHQPVDDRFVTR